ncbi:MAG: aminotransferase class V-fold PLP-dependent enzyme [Dehalococcoidia bacterium]
MTNIPHGADVRAARPVYLDCCATTPLLPEVRDEVGFFLDQEYGNAGSRTHEYGAAAKRRVAAARREVAAVAGVEPDEVVFTSGATESNNLAILGLRHALSAVGRRHIVTTRLEHKAVIEPIEQLEHDGFEVTWLETSSGGVVEARAITEAVRDDTGLVSLMHVNNETGIAQPIEEVARGLDGHAAFLHVDAAQGFGKELTGPRQERVDLVSVSAHKLHGPKGVGALVMRRRGFERPPLSPLAFGGGQERGLRPGTLPVHLIAGLGSACRLAVAEHGERLEANVAFRERALSALEPLNPVINGDESRALPHILNVSFPGADAEAVIVATKDLIAISNGSACTSHRYEPSHVLSAMGLSGPRIAGAVRLSWCHLTEDPDWDSVVARVAQLTS